MANIIYNGLSNPTNLVTFNNIPNILKITDTTGGTNAQIVITVTPSITSITPTSDGEYYINILGDTITNVIDSNNATNKAFYIGSAISTAAYIARALRNCPNIAANFSVNHQNQRIYLQALDYGAKLDNLNWDTNIINNNAPVVTEVHTEGSASSTLERALLDVNLYMGNKYITTLEKTFYNGECAFNLTPFLSTYAEWGKTNEYHLNITSLKGGTYNVIGSVSPNYITVGYMVNQGEKYLQLGDFQFAQNLTRNRKQMPLYVYLPQIDLSYYRMTTSRVRLGIQYLDSAFNVISTGYTEFSSDGDYLRDCMIELDEEALKNAFYVDIIYDDVNTIRYNVIKPLKAAEYTQRVYWRNSYGGVSFFDFTGSRSETRDIEVETYEKNLFDYYETDVNTLKQIYSNEVEYEVTLKSHLIENDGKYLFNDLMQSSKVWTEVNGQTYEIIIKSVSAEEVQNDVYEFTVKYNYSMDNTSI